MRLLKFLRDHKGNFSVPSVILTALAGEAIQEKDADGEEVSTMADTVATVLSRIDERLQKCDQVPVIANPANPDLTFNTHWEDNQHQNFRRLMGSTPTPLARLETSLIRPSPLRPGRNCSATTSN